MKQNWTYKKLGDIATFSRGLTFAKGDVADMSSKKVLRSNNIDLNCHSLNFDDVACLNEDFVIPDEKKLHKGDIFICMSNGSTQHLGKVAFVEEDIDYAFGGFMGAIHPNQSETNSKFVFYACLSHEYRRFLSSVFNGVNINNLKWSDLSKFSIPVPPIETQSRIVSELDLLQSIIDKQQAQLKELDKLAQSIFYDMFGDPVENEKGWDVIEMGELFEIGSSKRVFEAQWTESGVPFYRAREIVKLSKNEPIDSPIFISEELYQEYSKKYGVPSAGDMMVTAVGTLGVTYIVKASDKFYFKDGNTLWFKSKGLCETRFIKDEYSTDYVIRQIQGNANAAVVGTYTIMNAKKTKVVVPPISLQKKYVAIVESIEKQKDAISQSIAETQKLFDYTMDKYFGE